MKIMVSGVGSVGGYLTSYLCKYAAAGDSITAVVRGRRREALEQYGLVLHSELLGECVSHPVFVEQPAQAGVQDVIFVCVKNYSLREALTALQPCVDVHTVVVPILNGIDHYAVTRECLPAGHVLDTLIYIFASGNADYSTNQAGKKVRFCLAAWKPEDRPALEKVRGLFAHPGITCVVPEDMEAELWMKFITNCGFNVITAYYGCDIQGIREHPERLAEYRALLDEACAVGRAKGVALPENLAQLQYERVIVKSAPHLTSSMAQDVMAGRRIELDTFGGVLSRLADQLAVPAPVTKRLYEAMKARIQAGSI